MVESPSLSILFVFLHALALWKNVDAFCVLPTSGILSCNEGESLLCQGRHLKLRASKEDGYKFGDITRGVLGKVQKDVNSLTGKSNYEFGDLSRWLDQQGRGKVSQWLEGFTNKADYEFGDLTREVIRRLQTGEYTADDVWLFLKIIALVGVNLQPVVAILPVKVVVQLLEGSVAQQLSEKVVNTLTTEVDGRMKEFVTGDRDYNVGDFTKQALTGSKEYKFGDLTKNAVKNVTGKDSYQFGDISRKFLDRRNKRGNNNGDSSSSKYMDIDAATEQALEAWDKEYLAAKRNDEAVANLELDLWDEKLLAEACKAGNSESKNKL